MNQNFKAIRIVKTYEMELRADAKTIFPLLCPVIELDWIEGWNEICDLIYTESGIAEEACVFTTNVPAEGKSVWICSKYEPENTEIEYIKHILDTAIIKWSFDVKDKSQNTSSIFIKYNATGLSETGNKFVTDFMENDFTIFMQRLEENINYYITTGKMKKNI